MDKIRQMKEEMTTDTPSDEPSVKKYSSLGDNAAEAILAFIAYFLLFIGIITPVIIGVLLIITDDDLLNIIGWIVMIAGIIPPLISWAILMLFINISNNTRQIKHLLQEMR